MGIDTPTAQLLCGAKSIGVDFGTTLTLGRQCIYPWLLDPSALQDIFNCLGKKRRADEFIRQNWYAEPLFLELGASRIESMDVSSYESPTMIHDLNDPIPESLYHRYSVVFDGGTLEHVFNIPQALKNAMQMVRVGGHLLSSSMANNCMGHGFWQLSPELMFRVFSRNNGFQVRAVLLCEISKPARWYVVSDPDNICSRVELTNTKPTLILTIAQRVADCEIFSTPPMQSDYVQIWEGFQQGALAPRSETEKVAKTLPIVDFLADLRDVVPSFLVRPMKAVKYRSITACKSIVEKIKALSYPIQVNGASFNQACYRPISVSGLLRGEFAHPADRGLPAAGSL